MTITYEEINPSPVTNATVVKGLVDGVHRNYNITPNEGYVLHDNRCDEEILDPVTFEPTGEMLYRYATGMVSASKNYDFTVIVPDTITDINGNTIAVNKVGAFEFFAVPASAIPENQTYGGSNNDHEVM